MLRELLHPDKADLVYYIMEGEGIMHINEETAKVHPVAAIYIPPRSRQFIFNTGKTDLIFLCIVYPAWRREDEEII
jgi:mannose-6-phosphate isomerase-like protein (cupin superfamily)